MNSFSALIEERKSQLVNAKAFFEKQLKFHPETLLKEDRELFLSMITIIDRMLLAAPKKETVADGDAVLIRFKRSLADGGAVLEEFYDVVYAYSNKAYPARFYKLYFKTPVELEVLTLPNALGLSGKGVGYKKAVE